MTAGTTTAPDPVAEAGKAALEQTADLLKTSSGFAAATLALSIGFLGSNPAVPDYVKMWLLAAWSVLALSIFFSIAAFAVLPPKFSDRDYTLNDSLMNFTGGAHLITLAIGFVVLAVAVILTAFDQPSLERQRVKSASDAIIVVRHALAAKSSRSTIQTVELVRGLDANRPSLATWHVKAAIYPVAQARAATLKPRPPPSPAIVDYFIDASTEKLVTVP